MTREILREALEDINNTTSEWALLWAQRVKTQRAQKGALDNIKEANNFDSIGQNDSSGQNAQTQ